MSLFIWLHCTTFRILVPWPGTEPGPWQWKSKCWSPTRTFLEHISSLSLASSPSEKFISHFFKGKCPPPLFWPALKIFLIVFSFLLSLYCGFPCLYLAWHLYGLSNPWTKAFLCFWKILRYYPTQNWLLPILSCPSGTPSKQVVGLLTVFFKTLTLFCLFPAPPVCLSSPHSVSLFLIYLLIHKLSLTGSFTVSSGAEPSQWILEFYLEQSSLVFSCLGILIFETSVALFCVSDCMLCTVIENLFIEIIWSLRGFLFASHRHLVGAGCLQISRFSMFSMTHVTWSLVK